MQTQDFNSRRKLCCRAQGIVERSAFFYSTRLTASSGQNSTHNPHPSQLAGSKRIVIASIGTDGSDGPTDIAGAVVDGYTLDEAHNSSIDLSERLRKHDSSNVLRKLKAAIYTNDTRTNLMDLMIVYVGSEEPSRMQKLRSCRGIEREVLAGLGVSQPEPVSNPE